MTESLTAVEARRLALARGGLLKPEWTGLPRGGDPSAAHGVIRRFGYLQLDTVSIAGARSHAASVSSPIRVRHVVTRSKMDAGPKRSRSSA